MYTFWKRAAPPASMEIMTPRTARRLPCGATAQHADPGAVTLNDVQFVEAARVLAENTLRRPRPTRRGWTRWRAAAEPSVRRGGKLPIVKASLSELRSHYKASRTTRRS